MCYAQPVLLKQQLDNRYGSAAHSLLNTIRDQPGEALSLAAGSRPVHDCLAFMDLNYRRLTCQTLKRQKTLHQLFNLCYFFFSVIVRHQSKAAKVLHHFSQRLLHFIGKNLNRVSHNGLRSCSVPDNPNNINRFSFHLWCSGLNNSEYFIIIYPRGKSGRSNRTFAPLWDLSPNNIDGGLQAGPQ